MHKDDLLKPRLPEAEIDTPAGLIRVRGLSRRQVLQLQHSTEDVDALDQKMLEWALLEPALTSAEVRQWRESWTQDLIDPITDKIAELSGMKDDESEVDKTFRPTT